MTTAPDPESLTDRLTTLQGQIHWSEVHVVDAREAAAYAGAHGYGDEFAGEHAPPGYGAALTMRAILTALHDERLALPFDRNVHAAQELEWFAPLRIGTRLRTDVHLESVRLRSRAVFFDLRSESTDPDGLLCMRGRATQAVRHG